MADRIYLSYRVRTYSHLNMLRHFEKVLRSFPSSRLSKAGLWIRLQPVSWDEPNLFEQAFPSESTPDEMLPAVQAFDVSDSAVEVEGHWDLWQFDNNDWSLKPSRVSLYAFGPGFESEVEDHLRLDLGVDSLYLPQGVSDNEEPMVQANIRSVLQLAGELDRVLPVESRRLWTESGVNFAEKLQKLLLGEGPHTN
jgi:hypothetical protein